MVGNGLKADPGTDVRGVSDYIVTSGLIDLPTHVYWGGASPGIIDHPPPSYEEVVFRLRPDDVLSDAFRPFPNSPATAQSTVKKVVLVARERGMLFDIGHGRGSFAFKIAPAMLANGFYPDTISSDVHTLCINGGRHPDDPEGRHAEPDQAT